MLCCMLKQSRQVSLRGSVGYSVLAGIGRHGWMTWRACLSPVVVLPCRAMLVPPCCAADEDEDDPDEKRWVTMEQAWPDPFGDLFGGGDDEDDNRLVTTAGAAAASVAAAKAAASQQGKGGRGRGGGRQGGGGGGRGRGKGGQRAQGARKDRDGAEVPAA